MSSCDICPKTVEEYFKPIPRTSKCRNCPIHFCSEHGTTDLNNDSVYLPKMSPITLMNFIRDGKTRVCGICALMGLQAWHKVLVQRNKH
jgi:hypothetical protein